MRTTTAARFRSLIPLVLAAAIAAGIYVWAKSITPDSTTSLFGQTGADTFPLKSWLATVVLVLAVLQLYTALWLYGRINRARARPPRRLGTAHRLTGAAAIVVTLPIAYHCMFAYGFRDFDSRTVAHSLAGCFLYGAIGAKVFAVRSRSVPSWALPLAGGTLVTVVVVLWYSSALWYFNDHSVPLLGGASSAGSTSSAPAYGAPPGGGKAVAVTMKDIRFRPEHVTAQVGQTITWTNQDAVDHNVIATSGASFKSSNFGTRGTYSFRITKPGKIGYVCTLHPGMDASVTVTPRTGP